MKSTLLASALLLTSLSFAQQQVNRHPIVRPHRANRVPRPPNLLREQRAVNGPPRVARAVLSRCNLRRV